MDRFAGKVAVVTGGAHGIGRASALRVAAEGADVAVIDIRDKDGEQTAAECGRGAGTGHYYHGDVTDPTGVAQVVQLIAADLGAIHVLHANAGRLRAGTVLETDLAEWSRILSVNLTGIYLVIRETLPIMQASGGGAIVTTGSISGLFGEPALTA